MLQMVLELDTGWCASEDARPQGGGWSYIGWIGEPSIHHKSVETSP